MSIDTRFPEREASRVFLSFVSRFFYDRPHSFFKAASRDIKLLFPTEGLFDCKDLNLLPFQISVFSKAKDLLTFIPFKDYTWGCLGTSIELVIFNEF